MKHKAAALLALALLLVPGCEQQQAEPEPVIRPVRTQQVFATGGGRVRSFSGVVQAGTESTLSFRVAGIVRRLAVRVGDRVTAGDPIAELDPTDYEVQAQQAEQSLRRSRAEARNAASNYERVRLLYENNNASLNDLDAAEARAESADAAVGSAEKNLQLLRLQLGYTRLRAPIAGSIAAVDVEVNENVRQGESVAVLQAGAKPEVLVSIPEVLIAEIKEGSRVEVTCDAMPGKLLSAIVSEVSIKSGGLQTTFPVTVKLDEDDPDIRPGMAAEVAFSFEAIGSRDLYLVPPVAVGEDREGRFVFVARATGAGRGVVERRPVKVGELTGFGLEVLEGLEEGDLLVTAGVSRIEDGLEVKLPDATEGRP